MLKEKIQKFAERVIKLHPDLNREDLEKVLLAKFMYNKDVLTSNPGIIAPFPLLGWLILIGYALSSIIKGMPKSEKERIKNIIKEVLESIFNPPIP